MRLIDAMHGVLPASFVGFHHAHVHDGKLFCSFICEFANVAPFVHVHTAVAPDVTTWNDAVQLKGLDSSRVADLQYLMYAALQQVRAFALLRFVVGATLMR